MNKNTILLSIFFVIFSACTDITDLNESKYNLPYIVTEENYGEGDIDINYNISDEAKQNLKQNIGNMGALFDNMTYEGCYNDYQRATNLTHDIYSGYSGNNQPNFRSNSPTYSYTDGWSALRWTHFYDERTADEYSTLIKTFWFSDEFDSKYRNAFYEVRIYWAFLLSMITDTYGSVPAYAYVRGTPVSGNDVKYDTQEEVYDIIFRMLDQAVRELKPGTCSFKFTEEEDRAFGGDELKWLRFANTLRLRLALRISNIDPERARKEGEAAMSDRYGLMQSNEDRMKTVPRYAPISMGGKDSGGDENVFAMISVAYGGELVMSKDLENYYRNQSSGGTTYTINVIDPTKMPPIVVTEKKIDPRCVISWFRPGEFDYLISGSPENIFNDYTGVDAGDQNVAMKETVKKYSLVKTLASRQKELVPDYWFTYSRETVWLGYAESRFLLAEAALRGWIGATYSPQTYFEEGIRASMSYYGISLQDMEDYISKLKIYEDPDKNPFNGSDKEAILEQIITQKWLAVFPNGNEGWAEFRRTGYPSIQLPLVNNSAGEVPDGKYIKRIKYPNSEKDNKYLQAIRAKGEDSQGYRLWWDTEDTNDDNGNRITPNNLKKSIATFLK